MRETVSIWHRIKIEYLAQQLKHNRCRGVVSTICLFPLVNQYPILGTLIRWRNEVSGIGETG